MCFIGSIDFTDLFLYNRSHLQIRQLCFNKTNLYVYEMICINDLSGKI